MAFMVPGIAKDIIEKAPKYKRIVEPFGDGGTLALYSEKKKPKEHIVNIEDEILFNLMLFIQGLSSADKKRLKSFDWVSSPETFDSVLAINAVDGPDLFYRFFYLKHFGVKAKDPEQPPTYDWLTLGESAKKILDDLKSQRMGLKKVTLLNEDPIGVMSKGGGSDTFLVLLPKKPEHIDAVEARLNGMGGNFFYAKKSKSNDILFEDVAKNPNMFVSTLTASTIMAGTMEVRTNYESKQIQPIDLQAMGYTPN